MSKELTVMPSTELMPAQVAVDKEDVLAIAVTQAETMANQKIDEAISQVTALDSRIRGYSGQSDTLIAADAAACFEDLKEAFTRAFALAEPKLKIEFKIQAGINNLTSAVKVAATGGEPRRVYKSYTAHFTISNVGRYGGLEFVRTLPVPAEVKQLLRKREKTLAQKQAAETTAYEWQRRLANVPMLERQARAKLAVYRLKQSKQGRDILKTMVDTLAEDVLNLPHK